MISYNNNIYGLYRQYGHWCVRMLKVSSDWYSRKVFRVCLPESNVQAENAYMEASNLRRERKKHTATAK